MFRVRTLDSPMLPTDSPADGSRRHSRSRRSSPSYQSTPMSTDSTSTLKDLSHATIQDAPNSYPANHSLSPSPEPTEMFEPTQYARQGSRRSFVTSGDTNGSAGRNRPESEYSEDILDCYQSSSSTMSTPLDAKPDQFPEMPLEDLENDELDELPVSFFYVCLDFFSWFLFILRLGAKTFFLTFFLLADFPSPFPEPVSSCTRDQV